MEREFQNKIQAIFLIITVLSANTISCILLIIYPPLSHQSNRQDLHQKWMFDCPFNSLNRKYLIQSYTTRKYLKVVIESARSSYTASNFTLISSYVFPLKFNPFCKNTRTCSLSTA